VALKQTPISKMAWDPSVKLANLYVGASGSFLIATEPDAIAAARNNQGDDYGYTFYSQPRFDLPATRTGEKYGYSSGTPASIPAPGRPGAAKFGWSSREGYGYQAFGYDWPNTAAQNPFTNPQPVYRVGPSNVESIAFASDTYSVKFTGPYFVYTSFPGAGVPTNFQRHSGDNTSGGNSLAGPTDGYIFGGLTPVTYTAVNPPNRALYHNEQYGNKRWPFSSDNEVLAVGGLGLMYHDNWTRSGFASETDAYLAGGQDTDGSGAAGRYPPSTTAYTTEVFKMSFARNTWQPTAIADTAQTGSRYASVYNSNENGYLANGNGPPTVGKTESVSKMPFTSDTDFVAQPASLAPGNLSGPSTSTGGEGFTVMRTGPLANSITKFPFSSEDSFSDVGELLNTNNNYGPSHVAN